MKVLLAVHGYPPELVGGTEGSAQTLARACARRGIEVMVVAGSLEHGESFRISESTDRDPDSGAGVRVRRFHRSDLYFDHWQKLHSPEVGEAFSALLEQWQPDVVHVMHWLRLSDDLVLRATRAGLPALVTLNDHLASCLLALRVHPVQQAACTKPYSPEACLPCASQLAPRTPWVGVDMQQVAFAQRRARLERELSLAQRCIVPSLAHGEALAMATGLRFNGLVIPPARLSQVSSHERLPAPKRGTPLRLGCWSGGAAIKGTARLLDALCAWVRAGVSFPVELRIAGPVPLDLPQGGLPDGLNVVQYGTLQVDEIGSHGVSDVHAMVSGTLAPESYGLVADEAFDLGLPMILPKTPALLERFEGISDVFWHDPQDSSSLRTALDGLSRTSWGAPVMRPAEVAPSLDSLVQMYSDLWGEACANPAIAEVPPASWFEQRMALQEQVNWDRHCSKASPRELGLE